MSDEVDLACRGFQNAVQAFCRRYTVEPQPTKEVEALVQHSAHFLKQLTSKRKSLENGLSYLRHKLWPSVLDRFRTHPEERTKLLQHFLEQSLRLHDGLVLLVSGECRHKGDIRMAKKQPPHLRSKLKLQRPRGDGYTILFNAPGGYSGYGFDEFFDEELGIKVRLLDKIQKCCTKRRSKKKIWDYLLSHGGQAFDTVLEQHESAMINLGFTALKHQVVKDLKLVSAKTSKNTKVSFVLHDKMEKLQYRDISLERQGDQFQVEDPKGALPNGYTVQNWERIMKLPDKCSTQNNKVSSKSQRNTSAPSAQMDAGSQKNQKTTKKRRRIIEDSEDSSDDEKGSSASKPKQKVESSSKEKDAQPQTPNKISGLNVKIRKETKPPTPGEAASPSLTRIKAKFGVQGETLEASREVVELEEANATKAANAEEAEAMAITIKQGEANIQSQRRVLQRALSRNPDERDVNEIWDAREVLREQLMTVGNQILDEGDPATADRKAMLIKAHKLFEDANQVVGEQEVLRRSLNSHGKHTPAEARFFARNLLLLQGRAYTNMGLTSLDLASATKRKTDYKTAQSKQYLRQALDEFSRAKEYSESLRLRSERDRVNGSDGLETKADAVRADALESLAMRGSAQALWHQGSRKEASEKFDFAASFFSESESLTDNHLKDEGLQQAVCDLGAECYLAHALFADLALAQMESLPPTGAVREGDELLSYRVRGLRRACHTGDTISKFVVQRCRSNDDELDVVLGREEIQKMIVQSEKWWDQQKTRAHTPIAVDTISSARNTPFVARGDVSLHASRCKPTGRFVVHDASSWRRKKSKGPNPMYHQRSGELLTALPEYSEQPDDSFISDDNQTQKYRPWGDELMLPGGKLQYPSNAPPMPAHIRAQLQAAN